MQAILELSSISSLLFRLLRTVFAVVSVEMHLAMIVDHERLSTSYITWRLLRGAQASSSEATLYVHV